MALYFADGGRGDRRAYFRAIDDAEERLGRFAAMLQLDARTESNVQV